jgi:hypothetical protein
MQYGTIARRSIIPKNAGVDNQVRVQGHGSKGKTGKSRKLEEGARGALIEKRRKHAQPTQPNNPDQEQLVAAHRATYSTVKTTRLVSKPNHIPTHNTHVILVVQYLSFIYSREYISNSLYTRLLLL